MSAPIATLLPLGCLPNFAAGVDFIRWLKKTQQNGWQLLPLAHDWRTPYRNQGIGLSPYYYDPHIPEDFQTWMLTREDFAAQMSAWLGDYALYQALSQQLGNSNWWTWPEELMTREPSALEAARVRLAAQIETYIDQQYFLYNEMAHLRRLALENEVSLIGDLPFYIDRASSLVWAHQKLFMLGERGEMRLESGVPAAPDEPFVQQYWGHPLYNWENSDLEEIMALFEQRLAFMRGFCEIVRIDHANGFFRYGAMSPEHPGWNKKLQGPGKPAATSLLGKLQSLGFGVYFEDIASDKMRLELFMKEFDVAGSGVATLTYNVETTTPIPSSKIKDRDLDWKRLAGNRMIFSSTHDTPTLLGWMKALPPDIRERVIQINGLSGNNETEWAASARNLLTHLEARMIVIAWQDWWGQQWRLNVPGHEELADWMHRVELHL